jgi:hypothetical protein
VNKCILRIESPEDIAKVFGRIDNAKVIAEEFNRLLEYFQERERAIEKESPGMARYAGFTLSAVITSLAMTLIDGTSEKISANILHVSRGLKQLPGSGNIVFFGKEQDGQPN